MTAKHRANQGTLLHGNETEPRIAVKECTKRLRLVGFAQAHTL
jgi:hypothetical protein